MKAEIIFRLSDTMLFDYAGGKSEFPVVCERNLAVDMVSDIDGLRTALNSLITDNMPKNIDLVKSDFDQKVKLMQEEFNRQYAAGRVSKVNTVSGDALKALLPPKEADVKK